MKISDFGVSLRLPTSCDLVSDYSRGTPAFLPPEWWSRGPLHGKPLDVWSLGCVFYWLIYGRGPFGLEGHQAPTELEKAIIHQE